MGAWGDGVGEGGSGVGVFPVARVWGEVPF